MAKLWNPQAVLDVDPDSHGYTCVGTTKKNERCRLAVNRPDRQKAARMLDSLAYQRPESDLVRDTLDEIAELCLCKRWHRDRQVDDIVMQWNNIITEFFPTAQRRGRESFSSTVSSTISISSRYDRSLAPSPSSAPMTRVSVTVPSTLRTSAGSVQTDPWDALSWNSHTWSTARSLPETPELRSPQAVPHIYPIRAVTRRPITENCVICEEEIRSPEDAVWCRAQCGKNIHSECWGVWRAEWLMQIIASDADEEQQLCCVACRAPWVEASFTWAELISSLSRNPTPTSTSPLSRIPTPTSTLSLISTSTHSHHSHEVTRRPITGECGICFDEIQSLDDAVWCRRQCGQNVHRGCWNRWSNEQRSRAMDTGMDLDLLLRCVFCRAQWDE